MNRTQTNGERLKAIREDFEFLPNGYRITAKNLSEKFVKMGYKTLQYEAIRKLETDRRNLQPNEAKAYCDFFNLPYNYVMNIDSIKTRDIDITSICKKLGLGDKSIKKIMSLDKEQQKVLDMIICDSNFYELIAKTQNYLHSGNVGILIPDMTKQEEIENESDEYKVNDSLQFDSALIHQFVICEILKNILSNIYTPYNKIASELFINDRIRNIFCSAFSFQENKDSFSVFDYIEDVKSDYDSIRNENSEHKILKYDLTYIFENAKEVWKEIFKTEPPKDYTELLEYNDYAHYDL